jgi:type II secretory pathway component PulF
MYDFEEFERVLLIVLHFALFPFLIRMLVKRRYRKRQRLLAALLRRLNNGEPLSEAMRKLHRFFPPHHADLVATGERTGQLADCLTQLESDSSIRLLETQGNRLPFGYLTLVLLSTVVITTFLYIKVHPVFAEVLEDFGVDAEELQHVYPLEDFERAFFWCLNPPFDLPEKLIWYCLPVLFVAAFRLFLRRPRVVSSLLRIPWFGHTATLRSLHHASLLLGRELDAGIPMVEALGHVAAADIPAAHRRVFERVRARLQQGETMGDALREARHGFPPGFVCFVELGEQSGQLPQALKQVAQLYWPVIQARQRITRTVTLCTCVLAVSALVLVVVETTFALNVAIIDACFYAL